MLSLRVVENTEVKVKLRYHEFTEGKIRISLDALPMLKKAHYGVYGHATVELCHWTKSALTGGPSCYKVKFYGAPVGGSHRCVEMGPVGMMCSNKCIYCWRPSESFDPYEPMSQEVMDPVDMVNGILKERKRLLSGYFGHAKSSRVKVNEALQPTHWAISLSGEPTMYPRLPELIKYIKSLPNTKSVFLVTNGLYPEMIEKLWREDALPTQLYLSLNAPNKELFLKIANPVIHRDDAWERVLRSLELLAKIPTRTVVRITLIKGWNTGSELLDQFAEVLSIGNPHFIEPKSYMHLGHSVYKLSKFNMLRHEEVKEWSLSLLKALNSRGLRYVFMDEDPNSRITVLQNMDRYVDRWIEKPSNGVNP